MKIQQESVSGKLSMDSVVYIQRICDEKQSILILTKECKHKITGMIKTDIIQIESQQWLGFN